MKKQSLRERMPQTAKIIDQMRESMGTDVFNEILRKAMSGEPGYFFAQENGFVFGTRDTGTTSVIGWDARGIAYSRDPKWITEALQLAAQRGIHIERLDPTDPDETKRLAVQLRKILAEGIQ